MPQKTRAHISELAQPQPASSEQEDATETKGCDKTGISRILAVDPGAGVMVVRLLAAALILQRTQNPAVA